MLLLAKTIRDPSGDQEGQLPCGTKWVKCEPSALIIETPVWEAKAIRPATPWRLPATRGAPALSLFPLLQAERTHIANASSSGMKRRREPTLVIEAIALLLLASPQDLSMIRCLVHIFFVLIGPILLCLKKRLGRMSIGRMDVVMIRVEPVR